MMTFRWVSQLASILEMFWLWRVPGVWVKLEFMSAEKQIMRSTPCFFLFICFMNKNAVPMSRVLGNSWKKLFFYGLLHLLHQTCAHLAHHTPRKRVFVVTWAWWNGWSPPMHRLLPQVWQVALGSHHKWHLNTWRVLLKIQVLRGGYLRDISSKICFI